MSPAFAVVMLGTNDVFKGTEPSYELRLKALVDDLVARKIVPILSTIPPLRDTRRNPIIVKMNEIVRKVAAQASIPLMDFHLAVRDLPRFGLSQDGIHPFEAKTGACDFRAPAMNAGYNQRNLLTLRALDGVRRAALP
jgi:lysophospholipase L1-like esterase